MDEKRKISGVRTDLFPEEVEKKLNKNGWKKQQRSSGVKKFFGRLGEFLTSFGILPVMSSSHRYKGHRGHAHDHNTSNNFRDTYRVNPQPQRSHEDWVRDEMARDAYMKMVDGKGDHDCGHEH